MLKCPNLYCSVKSNNYSCNRRCLISCQCLWNHGECIPSDLIVWGCSVCSTDSEWHTDRSKVPDTLHDTSVRTKLYSLTMADELFHAGARFELKQIQVMRKQQEHWLCFNKYLVVLLWILNFCHHKHKSENRMNFFLMKMFFLDFALGSILPHYANHYSQSLE